MRLLPKLKIISWTWTWLSTQLCFELFYFCIIAHSLKEKYMRQRDKISFPFHVSPIYLPWHNKFLKPKSGVLSCFPLFFPLSQLSLIYFFSLFSYHNSFSGHHKVGMRNLPPLRGCLQIFQAPHTKSCGFVTVACLERRRNPRYSSTRTDGSTLNYFWYINITLCVKRSLATKSFSIKPA